MNMNKKIKSLRWGMKNIIKITTALIMYGRLIAGWRPEIKIGHLEMLAMRPIVKTSIHAIFVTATGTNEQECTVPYLMRSFDEGVSFEKLGIPIPQAMTHFPFLAVDNIGNLHVVYDGQNKIYNANSPDNGDSWIEYGPNQYYQIIGHSDIGSRGYPFLIKYNGTLYVVWHDSRDENYEIYFKISSDNGNTWWSYHSFPLYKKI